LGAAEISFFCMDALAPSMRELVPEFEKASGHHVRTTIANAGTIAARLQSGEPADLGTSSSPRPFRSAAGNGQLQLLRFLASESSKATLRSKGIDPD